MSRHSNRRMENPNQRGAVEHVPKTMHIEGSSKKEINVGGTRLKEKEHNDKNGN